MSESEGVKQPSFAIIGLGFIFDRHLAAIEHVGGKLTVACDIDEAKAEKLDSSVKCYSNLADFYNSPEFKEVDYVAICTPNYLHKDLAAACMRFGKTVICEKPLALMESDIDELKKVEEETGQRVFTVMQLRQSPALQKLRYELQNNGSAHFASIDLSMHRGEFYWEGWKGDLGRSGGLLFNIGVHYFDLLCWLFGDVTAVHVGELLDKRGHGVLKFGDVQCKWSLDLTAPKDNQKRNLTINQERLNLTRMLESLHNNVYELLLKGEGTSLEEVRPVTRLCENMSKTYGGKNV